MNSIYDLGQRFLELRLARWGVKGVQVARKVFLGLLLALGCVVLFTAGAFIAVTDAVLQSERAGTIEFSGIIIFGIVMMLLTGFALAQLLRERWWLDAAGIDRLLSSIKRARAPTVERGGPEKRLEELIEESVTRAMARRERQEPRPARGSRYRDPEDLIH